MKNLLLSLIFFGLTCSLFGQKTPSFNSLLDTAAKNSGLFIGAYPVKKINLHLSDFVFYREYLKFEYDYQIDSALLVELIINSNSLDTSKWEEDDFKNFVLVEGAEDYINPKDIVRKFALKEKGQIKKLKRRIAAFNNTHTFNRDIYYFSRPVFDSSKTFAIISHGNGNKGLMGRDYISLFHYNGKEWTKVGVVTRWIY